MVSPQAERESSATAMLMMQDSLGNADFFTLLSKYAHGNTWVFFVWEVQSLSKTEKVCGFR
jgi:hypothetical protein